jgi:hypothetical protein
MNGIDRDGFHRFQYQNSELLRESKEGQKQGSGLLCMATPFDASR